MFRKKWLACCKVHQLQSNNETQNRISEVPTRLFLRLSQPPPPI